MQPMKFFVDTHDHRSNTFPAGITPAQFAEFFKKYEQAAREEGVVILRTHVGFEEGRAFCFNMAPSVAHIERARIRQAAGRTRFVLGIEGGKSALTRENRLKHLLLRRTVKRSHPPMAEHARNATGLRSAGSATDFIRWDPGIGDGNEETAIAHQLQTIAALAGTRQHAPAYRLSGDSALLNDADALQ